MSEVIGLKIQVDSNASEAVGSLRSQLKQAQADVAAMADKFGVISKEAIEAAKRAGELRDKIGDAKSMADAFNPDAKFKALTASLSGVAGGFAAVQGAMGLMGTESKDLEKQLVKVQSAMAISQGLQSLGESIDSFKQLGSVIKDQVVTAFSTLKGAIVATGLGLFVIIIAAIVTNWKEFVESIEKAFPGFKKIEDFFKNFQQIASGVLQGVIAYFKTIGQIMADIFSGEFKKAYNDAKNIGENVAVAYNQGFEEKDKELKLQASMKSRKLAIDLAEAEGKDVMNVKLKYMQDELSLLKKGDDDYNAKLIEITKLRKSISDKAALVAFENRKKDIIDPLTGSPIKDISSNNEVVIDLLKQRATVEIDIAKDTANAKAQIRKEEVAMAEATADQIGKTLSALSDMVGENTVAGKGLAIASATISTYLSAVKAYESQFMPVADVTSPFRGALAAAAAVATGIATIRKIAAVQIPNSSGGGGSAPTPSGYSFNSGGSAPIQAGASVTTTSLSQGTLKQLQTQPIRAYVVENDITTNQDRIKRIEGAAVFGG